MEEAGRDMDNHRRIFGVSRRHILGPERPEKGVRRAWDLEVDRWAGPREATVDELGVRISAMTSSVPYTVSRNLNHPD